MVLYFIEDVMNTPSLYPIIFDMLPIPGLCFNLRFVVGDLDSGV